MAAPFFSRLSEYYQAVGKVLRGEAESASIFPNTTDIGMARENVYREFLRLHSPSKCNVVFGGYLFDEEGNESKQVDLLVTTDVCPQFNFHNRDGNGKTFACVEGTLACATIKSNLNKAELEDALTNLASIPPTKSLVGRKQPNFRVANYDDWPYKIIYASDGIGADTLSEHLMAFYARHPEIPLSRRPNIIHVAGKYMVIRSEGNELLDGNPGPPRGEYSIIAGNPEVPPDVQAILWTIDGIQTRAAAATHILFRYDFLINKILE